MARMHQMHRYLPMLQDLNPSKVLGEELTGTCARLLFKSHMTYMCSDITASNKDVTSSSLKMTLKCYDVPRARCIQRHIRVHFNWKTFKMTWNYPFWPTRLTVSHATHSLPAYLDTPTSGAYNHFINTSIYKMHVSQNKKVSWMLSFTFLLLTGLHVGKGLVPLQSRLHTSSLGHGLQQCPG